MAVTRDGIPVRVWCWPGNTSDSPLIRQVRDELRDWTLGKVIWVADRGFTSAQNRRDLRRGGGHYILGREAALGLRGGDRGAVPPGPLPAASGTTCGSRRSRSPSDERFVICHNPDSADRDAAMREIMTGKLTALIAGTDRLTPTKRAELRGLISTKPGLNRFLRVTPAGCCASTRRRSPPTRTWTGSTCCAPPTRTCPPRTSRWATSSCWRSNAAGGT